MSRGIVSFLSRKAKTIVGSVWTPPSGTAQINGDLEVTGQVKDAKFEIVKGSAGSVAVISDVTAPTLQLRALGKLFDKNVLLRTGDEAVYSLSSHTLDGQAIVNGDTYLTILELISNDITANAFYAIEGATSQLYDTNSIYVSSDPTGRRYFIQASDTSKTNAIKTVRTGAFGSATMEYASFNLTALGTLTADQVQMMTDLSTLNDWTITGTADTWANIGTWLNTPADREAFFALVIPSHVSSMDTAKLEEIVVRGGNLAFDDGQYSYRNGYADETANITWNEGGFVVNDDSITADSMFGYFVPVEPNTEYSMSALSNIPLWDIYITEFATNSGFFTGGIVNHSGDVGTTLSLTTNPATRFLLIGCRMNTTAPSVGDTFSNIQLNQGSTANTYATPLDAGITFGSRSENQLRNGNGEEGTNLWLDESGEGALAWNGSEFTVTSVGTASVWYADCIYNGAMSGIVTAKDDGTTDGRIYFTVFRDGVLANPSNSAELVADGWVNSSAGKYYKALTSSYVDYGLTFPDSDNTSAQIRLYASSVAGVSSAKELQFVKGEYTLAELQDKPYESFRPLELLTCPANGTTVSDELIPINGVPNILHNVTDNRTDSGDPEIDPTEIAVDGGFDDSAKWTTSAGATVDDSGDSNLVITASGGSEYVLSAVPAGEFTTVLGDVYLLHYVVENNDSNDEVRLGSVSTDEAFIDILSVADLTAGSHTVRLIAKRTGSDSLIGFLTSGVLTLSSISINKANIQENTAPNLEDISAFVLKGSLIQETTEGQNHIVSVNGIMLSVTHLQGISGAYQAISEGLSTKMNKTDFTPDQRIKVVLPLMTAGDAEVFLFSEFNAVDPNFPSLIEGAVEKEYVFGDTDITIAVYDTAIVFMAGGDVADNVECTVLIGEADPQVSIDRSA